MRQSFAVASESVLVRSLALMGLLCLLPIQQVRTLSAAMDPDIWWHVRVGQWILHSHSFPRVGIFSQSGMSRPWAAYSWGFETLIGALSQALGFRGAPVFAMAMDVIIVFVLFVILRRLSGSFWWAWLLTFAAVWGINLNWVGVGRPVMSSILFFTIELGLIFSAQETRNPRYLYWLAPLFLIWANSHIQFVYGLVPLGLLATVVSIEALVKRNPAQNATPTTQGHNLAILWTIVTITVAATLLNPYGIGLYKVVFNYVHDTFAYTVIQEFHALNFREGAHYVELLLALMAFFALGRRKTDPFRFTLLLIVSLICVRCVRDAWFLCFAAAN
jgi:hypothetical protein